MNANDELGFSLSSSAPWTIKDLFNEYSLENSINTLKKSEEKEEDVTTFSTEKRPASKRLNLKFLTGTLASTISHNKRVEDNPLSVFSVSEEEVFVIDTGIQGKKEREEKRWKEKLRELDQKRKLAAELVSKKDENKDEDDDDDEDLVEEINFTKRNYSKKRKNQTPQERRKEGIALLKEIAKEYEIDIVIQPQNKKKKKDNLASNSSSPFSSSTPRRFIKTSSSIRKEKEMKDEMEEKQDEKGMEEKNQNIGTEEDPSNETSPFPPRQFIKLKKITIYSSS